MPNVFDTIERSSLRPWARNVRSAVTALSARTIVSRSCGVDVAFWSLGVAFRPT
jgi:hypothetical protein